MEAVHGFSQRKKDVVEVQADAEGPLDVILIKTDSSLQSDTAMSFFFNRGHFEQQVSEGSLSCHSNWQSC